MCARVSLIPSHRPDFADGLGARVLAKRLRGGVPASCRLFAAEQELGFYTFMGWDPGSTLSLKMGGFEPIPGQPFNHFSPGHSAPDHEIRFSPPLPFFSHGHCLHFTLFHGVVSARFSRPFTVFHGLFTLFHGHSGCCCGFTAIAFFSRPFAQTTNDPRKYSQTVLQVLGLFFLRISPPMVGLAPPIF